MSARRPASMPIAPTPQALRGLLGSALLDIDYGRALDPCPALARLTRHAPHRRLQRRPMPMARGWNPPFVGASAATSNRVVVGLRADVA